MQPVEAVDFFLKQSVRAEKGLAAARSASNYQLTALNARQLFKGQLMRGLLTWRLGEDARAMMSLAVDTVSESASALLEIDFDAKVGADLPLERAAIVACLLDTPIGFRASIPATNTAEQRLDRMLISALNNSAAETASHSELEELAEIKGVALAVRSYRTYFEILIRSSTGSPIEDLLLDAEKNYLDRATDAFYSGGEQTEGGGPDNKLVVDYRLAAVLKKVDHAGHSVHRWRW